MIKKKKEKKVDLDRETYIHGSKDKVNTIDEYFKDTALNYNKNTEVFKANESDVDIKTELDLNRIVGINTLFMNDLFLIEKGLKAVYKPYYEKQMRLLISKERKSRGEFVEVSKSENNKDILTSNSLIRR